MSRDPLSVQVDLYGVWDINVERNFLALELYCMNSPISLYDNRGMAPNNSRRIVNNLILLASWWNEDCARCGPDITDSLKALRINVFSEFEQLKRTNPSKARSSCSIFSPGSFSELKYAISGWDIGGLAFEDVRIRRENGVSRCPLGNGCSETVMVNGQCHWKWSVNYLLFGWMAKLCDCPKERMSKLIRAWKTIKPKDYGKINNAVSFAEWAYDGFPDGEALEETEFSHCKPCDRNSNIYFSSEWPDNATGNGSRR